MIIVFVYVSIDLVSDECDRFYCIVFYKILINNFFNTAICHKKYILCIINLHSNQFRISYLFYAFA